jgi:hypothetical protein
LRDVVYQNELAVDDLQISLGRLREDGHEKSVGA